MPAFSDVPDRDAHIPEEPGPDVERYWPASTRAIAIEYARRARLRSRGERAVDDATLERVADAIMDPANPPPWRLSRNVGIRCPNACGRPFTDI